MVGLHGPTIFKTFGGFMLAKKCDVTIYKGMQTRIPKNIYEHEVKIFEGIYGEGSVEYYKRKEHYFPEGKNYKVEGDDVSYSIEELETDEEYDRMGGVYGMHPEIKMSWVEYIYGPRQEGRLESEGQKKYAAEFERKVYAPGTKKELAKAGADGLGTLTTQELKNLLVDNAITYTPLANKVMLLNLARKAGLNVATKQENAGGVTAGTS
jgi:hypothetical protein